MCFSMVLSIVKDCTKGQAAVSWQAHALLGVLSESLPEVIVIILNTFVNETLHGPHIK
jgi:hypothetical protein